MPNAHFSLAFLFCFKGLILVKKLEAAYFAEHANSFPISGIPYTDDAIPADTKKTSAIAQLKGPVLIGHQWGLGG